MKKHIACVLGASGFIGSYLVRELLHSNIEVRAGIRHPNDGIKTKHLKLIADSAPANAKLSFWHTDIQDASSIKDAITGCDWVFHLANPTVSENFPYEMILGTRNILNVINKTGSVSAFAMVSSISAILSQKPRHQYSFSESDWFDGKNDNSYAACKTQVERMVWTHTQESMKARDLTIFVVNPTLVVGASMTPFHNLSGQKMLADLANGRFFGAPPTSTGIVHVVDVARVLVDGMSKRVSGRFILNTKTMWFSEILATIKQALPERKIRDIPLLANLRFLVASARHHGMSGLFDRYQRWDDISSAKSEKIFGMKWRQPMEAIIDFCRSQENFPT